MTWKLASCLAVLAVAAPEHMAFARVTRTCEYYHYSCMQLHENPRRCDRSLATAMSTGNADIGYWPTGYDGTIKCLKK